jgi:hypothetical protein
MSNSYSIVPAWPSKLLRFPKTLSQRLRATRVPAADILIDIVERPMHASRVAWIATSPRSSFRQGRKKMPPYHSPQGSCYPVCDLCHLGPRVRPIDTFTSPRCNGFQRPLWQLACARPRLCFEKLLSVSFSSAPPRRWRRLRTFCWASATPNSSPPAPSRT